MPAGTRFDCYAALLRCFAPPVSGRSIADPDPRGATRASHVQRCPEEWNTLEAERLEASRPEANGEERMCLICYEEKDDVIVIPHLNLIAGNIKDHRACASCLQAWGRAECPFCKEPIKSVHPRCASPGCRYQINLSPSYHDMVLDSEWNYCCTRCHRSGGQFHGRWCQHAPAEDGAPRASETDIYELQAVVDLVPSPQRSNPRAAEPAAHPSNASSHHGHSSAMT